MPIDVNFDGVEGSLVVERDEREEDLSYKLRSNLNRNTFSCYVNHFGQLRTLCGSFCFVFLLVNCVFSSPFSPSQRRRRCTKENVKRVRSPSDDGKQVHNTFKTPLGFSKASEFQSLRIFSDSHKHVSFHMVRYGEAVSEFIIIGPPFHH